MKKGRLLAIGDVHGCRKALKRLLKWIDPQKEDTVVMLGDYVDRGPSSKGVIKYLMNWRWEAELVILKGNHEYIMEHARLSKIHEDYWCEVGGDETLVSYGGKLEMVPDEHWDFMKKARSFYETENYIFVHGGLLPKLKLEDQDQEEMAWRRFRDAQPHFSGKTVICGHTVQRKGLPRDKGHSICIDTGACRWGWLTCLDVRAGRYWQMTEKKGGTRMGKLPRKHRKARNQCI
ncbi:MAG: metallophosphoesterase family protein [Akkermansiaceae bacterium]